jgi:hypothetical protein
MLLSANNTYATLKASTSNNQIFSNTSNLDDDSTDDNISLSSTNISNNQNSIDVSDVDDDSTDDNISLSSTNISNNQNSIDVSDVDDDSTDDNISLSSTNISNNQNTNNVNVDNNPADNAVSCPPISSLINFFNTQIKIEKQVSSSVITSLQKSEAEYEKTLTNAQKKSRKTSTQIKISKQRYDRLEEIMNDMLKKINSELLAKNEDKFKNSIINAINTAILHNYVAFAPYTKGIIYNSGAAKTTKPIMAIIQQAINETINNE